MIDKAFSIAWHHTPYNKGGWTAWSSQDRQKYVSLLLEPQGRVYFSGDYVSGLTAWQAGAIESAWTQIEKLHARVMRA